MMSRRGCCARILASVTAFQVWFWIGTHSGCSWRHSSRTFASNSFCGICLGSNYNLRNWATFSPGARCSTSARRAVLDESDSSSIASAGGWANDFIDEAAWTMEEDDAAADGTGDDAWAVEGTPARDPQIEKDEYFAHDRSDDEFPSDGNMRSISKRSIEDHEHDVASLPPQRLRGTVSRWLNGRGIGWIVMDGTRESVFVHNTEIVSSMDEYPSLQEGEVVDFELGPDPFDSSRQVAVAVTGPNNKPVRGGYVPGEKVGWLTGDTITEVYVGNLAFRTLWWHLRDHFGSVGAVKQASVVVDGWDEKNNHPFSKGWGTVRFRNPRDARRAVRELNGSILHGRKIYVKPYQPRSHEIQDSDDDGAPMFPGY